MNNDSLLYVGFVITTVLYGGYWLTLKLRLAKLQKKVGR